MLEGMDEAHRELQNRVQRALRHLTSRERYVLRTRFGIGEAPQSAHAVSRRLGVTAQRVQRIETQALGTLRAFALGHLAGQSGRGAQRQRATAIRTSRPVLRLVRPTAHRRGHGM
jgi:sigma-70-like protein